ncbi:glucosamine-6-phosphate deaminase [Dehalobacterium formicoaceticum]|uniref:glucosamine-6-phosphate deaminase n=1 Tax=Dehalobacterium formicoaceticum TaxID=51515 RepID=UPI0030842167
MKLTVDILIRKDYNEMSKTAAGFIAQLVQSKPDCVLGLATGSTPIGTYRELIRCHREEGLDFSQVTTFNLDEYLGLGVHLDQPYSLDQSYARFMYEELIKHINIKKENTHVPDGLATDPGRFCQEYEAAIKDAGGIDLQLLGIGGDGHWAFNEPGSSLGSRTRVQALMKQTLDDNYKSFYAKAGFERKDMPHFAITMGVGTILEARNIIMIANGLKKANVVAQGIEGPVTAQITASAIQLHSGGITVVLDEDAASKLKHKEHYIHVERMKKEYNL